MASFGYMYREIYMAETSLRRRPYKTHRTVAARKKKTETSHIPFSTRAIIKGKHIDGDDKICRFKSVILLEVGGSGVGWLRKSDESDTSVWLDADKLIFYFIRGLRKSV